MLRFIIENIGPALPVLGILLLWFIIGVNDTAQQGGFRDDR